MLMKKLIVTILLSLCFVAVNAQVESEFEKNAHQLEGDIRNWKNDKDVIINFGVRISDSEIQEYKNQLNAMPQKENAEIQADATLPEDYEEPIPLDTVWTTKEQIEVELDDKEKRS